MSYITTINDDQYTTTINSTDAHSHPTNITLNEQPFALDWQKIAPLTNDTTSKNTNNTSGGQYSLILAGKSYQIFARPLPPTPGKEGQSYEIFLAGQRFEVFVEDERTHLLTRLVNTKPTHSVTNIQAPMPGLVVNVLVQPGDTVTRNQTIVVLEAMKMENDLAAPTAGTIKEVRVSKGQTVDQNEVLIIIDNTL